MNVTTSPASSAFMVIASSLPAHFNILAYMRSKASTTRRASFKNSLLVPPVAVAPRETLPPVATATAALRTRQTAHTFPAHISPAHAPPVARSNARTTPRTRAIATIASSANHPHHQSSCTQTREARRTIFARFIPIVNGRSHRKCANPSECNFNDTSETWDESMAWSLNPSIGSASKFASVTRSLTESRTFLRMEPWFKRASNIAVVLCCVRMCVRVRRADV